jgi:quinol monooxygenase YgiN
MPNINKSAAIMYTTKKTSFKTILALLMVCCLLCKKTTAQHNEQMVRLAKIKVDAAQLPQYEAALKTQMQTAIAIEPGVLTYYAMADKKDPTSITILEIYADTAAYQLHITTPHFKAYKEIVKNMVLSLELVDVALISAALKPH